MASGSTSTLPKELSQKSGYDHYSQFVSFEGSVVQQVEASVVLLGEVDVGHQNQDLDDTAEIFSDGVMEWCVPI